MLAQNTSVTDRGALAFFFGQPAPRRGLSLPNQHGCDEAVTSFGLAPRAWNGHSRTHRPTWTAVRRHARPRVPSGAGGRRRHAQLPQLLADTQFQHRVRSVDSPIFIGTTRLARQLIGWMLNANRRRGRKVQRDDRILGRGFKSSHDCRIVCRRHGSTRPAPSHRANE